MPELLVLNHHPDTGPSAFVEELDSLGGALPWRLVDLPGGAALPGLLQDVAGAVVLGGPMSATEPEAHPWMSGELTWLRGAVDAGVPVLGVCLGAQLLGSALGGAVIRRPRPEVGFLPLARTAAGRTDTVLGTWEDGAAALLMHEDEVSPLPPGAEVLLAGSDGAPAWRWGSALALQLHPEVTASQLAGWTRMEGLDALLAAAGSDPAELVAQARRLETRLVAAGRALLRRWISAEVLVRGSRVHVRR